MAFSCGYSTVRTTGLNLRQQTPLQWVGLKAWLTRPFPNSAASNESQVCLSHWMGQGCIGWTSASLRRQRALFLEAAQSERCWDPDEREGFMTVLRNVLCSGVTPYGAAAPALLLACCGHLVLGSRQTIDCSDASMLLQLDPAAFSFPSFPPCHSLLLILFWLTTSLLCVLLPLHFF